jgi:hypothetical protein
LPVFELAHERTGRGCDGGIEGHAALAYRKEKDTESLESTERAIVSLEISGSI